MPDSDSDSSSRPAIIKPCGTGQHEAGPAQGIDALGAVRSVERKAEELRTLLGGAQGEATRADVALPVLPGSAGAEFPIRCVERESELLATVLDSLSHPFLVINTNDLTIAAANAAAKAVGPLGSLHCYELTHRRDSPCSGADDPCPLQRVCRTGEPCVVEHIHYDAGGNPRNVEVHAHPVRDGEGRITQVIEYCLDITARKAAEAALIETNDLLVFALAKLTESRDPETGMHLERMRTYSVLLAEELAEHGPYTGQIDRWFIDKMLRASPLHDIGKVGIPDAVLLKPGHLSNDEFEIMKQHAVVGADALAKIAATAKAPGFLAMAAEIARSHHERFDGKGYPDGLSGQAIPLAARIVAVADVFDALSTARVYKPAFGPEAARIMITAESGKHFDPAVVEAMLARWPAFLAIHRRMSQ